MKTVYFSYKDFSLTLCGFSISAESGTKSRFSGKWSTPPLFTLFHSQLTKIMLLLGSFAGVEIWSSKELSSSIVACALLINVSSSDSCDCGKSVDVNVHKSPRSTSDLSQSSACLENKTSTVTVSGKRLNDEVYDKASLTLLHQSRSERMLAFHFHLMPSFDLNIQDEFQCQLVRPYTLHLIKNS